MTSNPMPLTSGKFTLYQTPKGGMHLSLQVDGEEEPRHVEIPSMMVKMMMRKARTIDVNNQEEYEAGVREFVTNGIIDEGTVTVPDFVDDSSDIED